MPRPPLPIGSWGKISRKEISPGVWRAIARFRDFDGVTRQLEKTVPGRSGAAAERALIIDMQDRANSVGADITRETRLNAVIELWWTEAKDKRLAERTLDRYRQVLDSHVIPGIGSLRVR